MKAGVPALNIIVSILYIIFTGLVAYWLKLSHKKRIESHQNYTEEQIEGMKKEANFDRLFAISWLKKYTLVGTCFNENRKYLVKEFFIMSIYAVTCLKINKIILWPVAFAVFLIPLVFGLYEVVIGYFEKKVAEE